MKPPHDPQDEYIDNIPELISHLWALYSAMTLDPALVGPAARIREAALELEQIRRAAWQVCQEGRDTQAAPPCEKVKRVRKKRTEKDAEWLKTARPASPLKQ